MKLTESLAVSHVHVWRDVLHFHSDACVPCVTMFSIQINVYIKTLRMDCNKRSQTLPKTLSYLLIENLNNYYGPQGNGLQIISLHMRHDCNFGNKYKCVHLPQQTNKTVCLLFDASKNGSAW